MDRTRWIIFGIICLILLGTLVLNKKGDDAKYEKMDPSKVITSTENGQIPDHTFGSDAKKVVLIEYGDFQCPGCGSLYPSMKQIKQKYQEELTFVFRNFPLTSIHPNALAAATAAEAAGLQDKWWPYHDILFENQKEWERATVDERSGIFVGYAKKLGLDINKFKKDLENKKIDEKISRDQALGKKVGATSTPTLVLNGKVVGQDKWGSSQKLDELVSEAVENSR